MYAHFFDLFKYLLLWITNPACKDILLVGLVFGVWYRFYRWFA